VQHIVATAVAAILAQAAPVQNAPTVASQPAPVQVSPAQPVPAPALATIVSTWRPLFQLVAELVPTISWQVPLASALASPFDLSQSYQHLLVPQSAPTPGGFVHLDIEATARFSMGPELSWVTPEPPREGYLKTQVFTPGWGVWYSPSGTSFAVGMATGTRFLLAEQSQTVVDLLTSEARFALLLR